MSVPSLSMLKIVLLFLVISCSNQGEGKRYGIKKGILVSESINSNNQAKSLLTLHFDDYGDKEYTIARSETKVDGFIKIREQHSLLIGEFLYAWDAETQKGTKYKYDEILDPLKLSKADFTEDMKKQFNYQEIGLDTIIGKPCEVISLSFNGNQGKMYNWKNLILKSEARSQGLQVVTQAISLDESPKFKKNLFDLPEGTIEFTEFIMPQAPPRQGSPR